MVVLATKDTSVSKGFLFYGGKATCFTDSTNIDTSLWVGFIDLNTQRGVIQSNHSDVFEEAWETSYVNPLVLKAITTKGINIS